MSEEKDKKRLAIVRAFELVLTFESDKSDKELEQEVRRIVSEINEILQTKMISELPQIDFDQKKKFRIGVLPVNN